MPTLRLPFREQLAEARKIDRLRACPSGRKCKVACSAPHVVTKKAKKPKEWEPKIPKDDTDEEDGDYSTESRKKSRKFESHQPRT